MRLSIISNNFSCKRDCWYCVWKNHPLNNVKGPTDFLKLKNVMRQATKISLSGGTDPANDDWLCNFVLRAATVPVDLHTSVFNKRPEFYNKFDKCVFHIRPKDVFDEHVFLMFRKLVCKIRLNIVATYETNYLDLDSLIRFTNMNGFEFGFRELYTQDNGLKCRKEKIDFVKNIEKICSSVKYIEQGDYNYYYMPNDQIYSTYLLKEN